MPELPEVETVRRSLLPLRGAVVKNVWASGLSLHQKEIPTEEIRTIFNNQEILELRRKGKYLLFDSKLGSVLIHLGMSGRLCISQKEEERPKHTHFVFEVESPAGEIGELRFIDPRRFGQVMCFARADEYRFPTLSALGLDPFDKRFSADFLFQSARKTKRNVKTFLSSNF